VESEAYRFASKPISTLAILPCRIPGQTLKGECIISNRIRRIKFTESILCTILQIHQLNWWSNELSWRPWRSFCIHVLLYNASGLFGPYFSGSILKHLEIRDSLYCCFRYSRFRQPLPLLFAIRDSPAVSFAIRHCATHFPQTALTSSTILISALRQHLQLSKFAICNSSLRCYLLALRNFLLPFPDRGGWNDLVSLFYALLFFSRSFQLNGGVLNPIHFSILQQLLPLYAFHSCATPHLHHVF